MEISKKRPAKRLFTGLSGSPLSQIQDIPSKALSNKERQDKFKAKKKDALEKAKDLTFLTPQELKAHLKRKKNQEEYDKAAREEEQKLPSVNKGKLKGEVEFGDGTHIDKYQVLTNEEEFDLEEFKQMEAEELDARYEELLQEYVPELDRRPARKSSPRGMGPNGKRRGKLQVKLSDGDRDTVISIMIERLLLWDPDKSCEYCILCRTEFEWAAQARRHFEYADDKLHQSAFDSLYQEHAAKQRKLARMFKKAKENGSLSKEELDYIRTGRRKEPL